MASYQRLYNVFLTFWQRINVVLTFYQRLYNVVLTSCAGWLYVSPTHCIFEYIRVHCIFSRIPITHLDVVLTFWHRINISSYHSPYNVVGISCASLVDIFDTIGKNVWFFFIYGSQSNQKFRLSEARTNPCIFCQHISKKFTVCGQPIFINVDMRFLEVSITYLRHVPQVPRQCFETVFILQ